LIPKLRALVRRRWATDVVPSRTLALRRLAASLVAVTALWPAGAFPANYRLVVDAPDELVGPIRERTLLGRWIDEEGFDPEQMPLFIERGREETAAIVRDAGYFSADVQVVVEPPKREAAADDPPAPPATVPTPAPFAGEGAADQQAPPSDASAGEETATRAAGADAARDPDTLPTVRIVVHAGPRTTVAGFEFAIEGPKAAARMRDALLQEWPLPTGSFFRPSAWEQGKRRMIDLLQQRGFMRAKVVASEARVDVQRTSATLDLRIESGPQHAFGPLTLRGLQRFRPTIVNALRPWDPVGPDDPGDPYDFDEVLLFQQRLRASGYFTSADVLPDLDALEADPDRLDVPIVVALRERRRQRLNFGVGVSSDEGGRVLAGYENRDLFGGGRGLQFDSGVLWQSVSRRAYATIRTPQRSSGHFDQLGARVERVDVQGELTDRQTLFIGRGKQGEEIDHMFSLQYQTEQRTVPLDPATDRRKALTVGYAWNLRRVDSRLDPRRGYTISAQLSGASDRLLSDRSFTRAWLRAMRFWQMPDDTIFDGGLLIGLFEAGQVFASSRQGIPTENLFRTGGTQTIRGYGYQSLGVAEGGATVGGRVLSLASLEYQHPIVRDWYGAAFVDGGNAADRWADWEAVYGIGVGLRWRSPVGPVAVDLAWGEADRRLRFHFSVGYAF